MRQLILVAALTALPAPMALAGPIERACNTSGRAASQRLCSCIQQAADLTLTQRDQTRAAKFFRDPHQAQEIRQSDRRSDEAFWQRYRAFGDTAEAFCGGA
ncbi:MAG: hypothetical protein OEM24_04290 [Paracoccaceae bacterium]|nr:hypothetical protein [Paracoccaceae bacterium]